MYIITDPGTLIQIDIRSALTAATTTGAPLANHELNCERHPKRRGGVLERASVNSQNRRSGGIWRGSANRDTKYMYQEIPNKYCMPYTDRPTGRALPGPVSADPSLPCFVVRALPVPKRATCTRSSGRLRVHGYRPDLHVRCMNGWMRTWMRMQLTEKTGAPDIYATQIPSSNLQFRVFRVKYVLHILPFCCI